MNMIHVDDYTSWDKSLLVLTHFNDIYSEWTCKICIMVTRDGFLLTIYEERVTSEQRGVE